MAPMARMIEADLVPELRNLPVVAILDALEMLLHPDRRATTCRAGERRNLVPVMACGLKQDHGVMGRAAA